MSSEIKLTLFILTLYSVLNLLQVLRGKCHVKGRPKADVKILNLYILFVF